MWKCARLKIAHHCLSGNGHSEPGRQICITLVWNNGASYHSNDMAGQGKGINGGTAASKSKRSKSLRLMASR